MIIVVLNYIRVNSWSCCSASCAVVDLFFHVFNIALLILQLQNCSLVDDWSTIHKSVVDKLDISLAFYIWLISLHFRVIHSYSYWLIYGLCLYRDQLILPSNSGILLVPFVCQVVDKFVYVAKQKSIICDYISYSWKWFFYDTFMVFIS